MSVPILYYKLILQQKIILVNDRQKNRKKMTWNIA